MKNSTFINRLKCLRELNSRNSNFINIDLYKLIIREDSLVAGYEKIKSNNGAIIFKNRIGTISLDEFGRKRLEKLRLSLGNESWSPNQARRIYISKSGKLEKRPLGIQDPFFFEKVVQSSMLMVLEAIYEPIFSKNSFGFRPGRGAHDALKSIEQTFDGMVYAIQGNIKGMYDNVNHDILITLLEKRISDHRFIRLVRKMLNAGYLESGLTLIHPDVGTPQRSIVSPILANIYLHEFDVLMSDLIKDLPIRNNRIRTPVYKELDNEMRKLKHQLAKGLIFQGKEEISIATNRLKKLKLESIGVRMYCDPSIRVFYTRYADDFIVGIAGSLEFSTDLRSRIGEFLCSLQLTLNLEKTKVTNIRKNCTFFLNHRIRIDTAVNNAYVRPKGKTPHLKRVTPKKRQGPLFNPAGHLVSIEPPINSIVLRLFSKGFCDHSGFPTPKKLWTSQEDNQIIDNFNATIRRLFGFYSGARKRHYLNRIFYILKFSCAYTLAAKHRCSLSKVFIKHGKMLRVNYGPQGEFSTFLFQPSLKSSDRKWQIGRKLDDP